MGLPDTDTADRVLRYFGPEILAYSVNTSIDDVERACKGDIILESGQQASLDELVQALGQVLIAGRAQEVPPFLLLSRLGRTPDQPYASPYNSLRERHGGEVAVNAVLDPVLNPLLALAREIYPILLVLPYVPEDFPMSVSSAAVPILWGHPSQAAFDEAVLADGDLSTLFPESGNDALSTSSYIAKSTGESGTLQLSVLSSILLHQAYTLCRLRASLNPGALFKNLGELVSLLRSAASGTTVRIPTFVGFTNVSLEMDEPLELAFGVVRTYGPPRLEFLPPAARPPVLGDEDIVLGFILETDFEYSIEVARWAVGDEPPQIRIDPGPSNAELDSRCESLSVSLALAIEREPPIGASRTWTMKMDPLSHGGLSWREARPPLPFYRLTEVDRPLVTAWTHRLESADDRRIAIARRRLLSALTERLNPVDGFIDAVITWENMFGSRQGESTLRISSAMASLLESDKERRLELSKRIADLYGSRSAVLHGGAEPSPAEAVTLRDSSLSFATRAMRRLYADFPELLADRDRARILILSL